jgi:DNA polymerase-4
MIYQIYLSYTNLVETFGQDECWLDITNKVNDIEEGAKLADEIRKEVKEKTGGLTISVGVSFTKVFAKLGSDLKKPYGLTVISRNNYKEILYGLPVQSMIFIGQATRKVLNQLNIFTIGDLAEAHDFIIINELGKNGEKLLASARGKDNEEILLSSQSHSHQSVGNGTTLPKDIKKLEEVERVIYALSEIVAFRLKKYNMLCNGVSLSVKDNEFNLKSKQGILGFYTCSSSIIANKAIELFLSFYSFGSMSPIRAITVTTYDLIDNNESVQLSFFESRIVKTESLERAIDDLRTKYGYEILKRGCDITQEVITGDVIDEDIFR